MKILMLTPYLPYPDSSGGQIRTQNLLKHLKNEHDITLFSLIKYPSEKKYIPILEKNFCKKVRVFYRPQRPWMLSNILRTGFSLYPFVVVRNFSPAAKKAIELELKTGDYDLIHAETFYAMPHIPKTDLPVVLVDQTIEFKVYQHYVKNTASALLRPFLSIDLFKIKYWETYYWRQADQVIAVSRADKRQMQSLVPGLDVQIVPNGVNLDLFKKKTSWAGQPPIILFLGNFSWMQNTEAAQILIQKILPRVQVQLPDARLLIIGQNFPQSLKNQASAAVTIKELPANDVGGIIKSFHQASVIATPLRGPGGTRLKNLAAMACQLPIVSSAVGMSGLGIKPGIHALIEDDPDRMADAVVRLIRQPELAKEIALAARRFVEEKYDYRKIAKKLSDIYYQVAQK